MSLSAIYGLRAAIQILFRERYLTASAADKARVSELIETLAQTMRESEIFGDAEQREIMATFFASALAFDSVDSPKLTLINCDSIRTEGINTE